MEASLTCAVCLGLFEEPVTLPLCSHNFCRCCVQGCAPSPQGPPQQICCPLCRKVSMLPGGATHLPTNTTLAEVVKLLRAAQNKEGGEEAAAAGCAEPCVQHPGRRLQLYCRVCHQMVCGQCVSEHHQGAFHSINLMDITYQEEKLAFFSTLKKLKEVGEKLEKELTDDPNDVEAILHNEMDMITSKFDEITRILDLKKKQMIENIAKQRSKKVKEHHLWRQAKDVDKETVGNFLAECDKIIDECDPQSFLKVACDLNKRMNTKLDLLHVSSGFVAAPQFKPIQMDIKPILDAISSLQITSDDNFKDPFAERKHDSKGNFTFQKSNKCSRDSCDVSSNRFCLQELHHKYYNHQQVAGDLIVDSEPENKNDACILPEGKPLTIPISHKKNSTLKKAKSAVKGKTKLTRHTCFDESNGPCSSIDFLCKPPTRPSALAISSIICERSQNVDGLSVSIQDNAHMSQSVCGTIFGETQTKSVTQSVGPAHLDTPHIKAPSRDLHSSLSLFSALSFTSNPNDVSFSAVRDTMSSTKEMNTHVSVIPNVHVEKCGTHDKCKLEENLAKLSNSSTSSSGVVSVISANLADSVIETTSGKPTTSFSFANSARTFSKFNAYKLDKSSPFSFTLPQSVKLMEKSVQVRIGRETKENMKNKDDGFSWLKLLAPDSKELNATDSKSWTTTKGTVEKDTRFKKTPSFPCNNILSFSSNNSTVKPQCTSGFSLGCTSKNTSLPLSPSFLSFLKVSESNIHEGGGAAINSSCLADSAKEQSRPVETAFVAGLENHSLFTFPHDLSITPPTTCTASESVSCSSNIFNAVQSHLFTREASSVSSHSLAGITVPQDKDKAAENGTMSENSKLCSDSEDSPQSRNTFHSLLNIQNDIPPPAACDAEPSGMYPNKVVKSGMLPVMEESDVDEANKETSPSNRSSTFDEETMRETKGNI